MITQVISLKAITLQESNLPKLKDRSTDVQHDYDGHIRGRGNIDFCIGHRSFVVSIVETS